MLRRVAQSRVLLKNVTIYFFVINGNNVIAEEIWHWSRHHFFTSSFPLSVCHSSCLAVCMFSSIHLSFSFQLSVFIWASRLFYLSMYPSLSRLFWSLSFSSSLSICLFSFAPLSFFQLEFFSFFSSVYWISLGSKNNPTASIFSEFCLCLHPYIDRNGCRYYISLFSTTIFCIISH